MGPCFPSSTQRGHHIPASHDRAEMIDLQLLPSYTLRPPPPVSALRRFPSLRPPPPPPVPCAPPPPPPVPVLPLRLPLSLRLPPPRLCAPPSARLSRSALTSLLSALSAPVSCAPSLALCARLSASRLCAPSPPVSCVLPLARLCALLYASKRPPCQYFATLSTQCSANLATFHHS